MDANEQAAEIERLRQEVEGWKNIAVHACAILRQNPNPTPEMKMLAKLANKWAIEDELAAAIARFQSVQK